MASLVGKMPTLWICESLVMRSQRVCLRYCEAAEWKGPFGIELAE